MIYWAILIILAISAFTEVLVTKKGALPPLRDKHLFYIIAFMMTMISALRFETGRDWENYISYFDDCLIEVDGVFEPGYSLLNKLFRSITDNYYIMQALCSVFSCSIIYSSIVKKSRYPLFSLFIYFSMFYLTMEMAVVRQSIAMAIICLGISFIRKRQLMPWILIILLAMQFHITSIIAFPLYYTMNKTITRKFAFSLVALALLVTIFGKNITENIIYVIGSLPFMPERLRAISDFYLQSVDYGSQSQFGSGLGYAAIQFFNFMIVFAYGARNKNGSYYMLNFCIALILIAFGRNFDVIGRLANYYLVCGGGLCAYNLLIDSKWYLKANSRVAAAMVCTMFLLFRIYTFYAQWGPDVIRDYTPYKVSVFQ